MRYQPQSPLRGNANAMFLAILMASMPAIAHASKGGEAFQDLVGLGSGLLGLLVGATVYVCCVGFFIYVGCSISGVKGSMGQACTTAIYISFFMAVIFGLYYAYNKNMDPAYAKAALVVGLLAAGALAVKTIYGESLFSAAKIFLMAALMAGAVMMLLRTILNLYEGTLPA